MIPGRSTSHGALPGPVAVVLAAGLGSRLGGNASPAATPKPVRRVAGTPLVGHALRAAWAAGIRGAVLVLGHRAETVAAEARAWAPRGLALAMVVNHRYEQANGLSVLAARPVVDGAFVLTMADHLVDPGIVRLALACEPGRDGAVLCVDRKLPETLDLEDATKVKTEAGRIVAIGKDLEDYDAIDTGVFHCSPAMFEAIAAEDRRRGDCSLSQGMARLARSGRAFAVDIGDLAWQDVDTALDLERAEKLLPSLTSGK